MKLVTGIEAIQSGKPWRHQNKTDSWINNDDPLNGICGNALLIKQFIIKEEPREFLLNILDGTIHIEKPSNSDVCDDYWIRVREVEK